jgi:hypothetical protein
MQTIDRYFVYEEVVTNSSLCRDSLCSNDGYETEFDAKIAMGKSYQYCIIHDLQPLHKFIIKGFIFKN